MKATQALLTRAIAEQYKTWIYWKGSLADMRATMPNYEGDRTDYFHSAKRLYDRLVQIAKMTTKGQWAFDQLLNNPRSKDALHNYEGDSICNLLRDAPSNTDFD